MLKPLAKSFLALCMVIAGTLYADAKPAKLKEMNFDVKSVFKSEIRVTSTNGEFWNHIEDGTFKFGVLMDVDTRYPGVITSLAVVLGDCAPRACKAFPLVWADTASIREYHKARTFTVPVEKAISGGRFQADHHQKIINTCNQASQIGPVKRHEFQHAFETTFAIATTKAARKPLVQATDPLDDWNRISDVMTHRKSGSFNVTVICEPYVPPPDTSDLQKQRPTRAGNTLYSVDLKVSQHGERCPKDVTVTAYANYKGPAKSHMRMIVDGGFPKFRVAETKKVTFAGKTFHRAEAEFHYKLDPGQKTFKLTVDKGEKTHTETVEITCPPFKVLSATLKYEVENTPVCPKQVTETATFKTTRPGWVNHEIKMQGGLVVSKGKLTAKREGDKYVATAVRHLTLNAIDKEFMADAVDYPANSGWVPLKVECLELKGDFSFVDQGSPQCPRTGKALINFSMNVPADIHYSLDCTNGHFSGIAKSVPDNKGGYVAPALVKFDIEKTTQATCALKSVSPGKTKVHTLKGHLFQCVTPSGHGATSGLTPETRPSGNTARNPRVPATLVPNALDKMNASPKTGANAAAKRLEAARKAAEDKRKREAAAAAERARKLKLKAALERKRAEAARKKAAEAAQAEARRKAAAIAAAKLKLLQKRRVPPRRRTTNGNTQQLQKLRLR